MAKPKLALVPAAQGSKLYSVLPSSGVGDFQFNRSGSATRINSQGLIETVASGVSRLNYPMIDGVVKGCPHHILEPQRTNLFNYSEDFSQGYWTKSDVSVTSGFVSPSGDLSAFKLTESNTNNQHYTRKLFTLAGEFSMSIFVKKAEKDKLWLGNISTTQYSVFDLTNETSINLGTTSSKIENYGNGWYRCSIVDTLNQQAFLSFGLLNENNNIAYQGDGISGLYVWGIQYEANSSYPTSYIPNYGTSGGVTRSAETANGSGDASTFNDSEGVLMVEVSTLVSAGSNRIISLTDGTSANKLEINFDTVTDRITVVFTANSSNQYISAPNLNEVNFNKIAIKYKTNDFALWVNGIELSSQLSGNTSLSNSFNKLNFSNQSGGFNFHGNTKQIQYFDTALTDSELEQLTSWVSFQEMAEGQLYSVE